MQQREIIIIGAGMVGVCTALALQKKGLQVTLLDSSEPGTETSFGNAGIITPSSLIPFNNPKLFKQLPNFLLNNSAGFRYSSRYLLAEFTTMLRFLSFSGRSSTARRTANLYQLIERSMALHTDWASAENSPASLRHSGWLKLYRNSKSFNNAQYEQDIYQQFNIGTQQLDAAQLHSFEPGLKDIYRHGVLINDALSVSSPGSLVKVYAAQFKRQGGELLQLKISHLQKLAAGWMIAQQCSTDDMATLSCRQLVIAAGPWSKQLLSQLDMNLPMLFERGGHREYVSADTRPLSMPIHDIDGSFVASPIANGLRISCGVELNKHSASHSNTQLDLVEYSARQALDFADSASSQWQGARPTMPDSLPLIGATKLAGLWLNTGHQHIGFSTGPASAELLANLVVGECHSPTTNCFAPSRFNL